MADTLFTVRSQFDPKGTDEALKGFGSVQAAIGNLGKAFSVFGRIVSAITLKNIVIFKAVTVAMREMVQHGREVVANNREMALDTGIAGNAMESLRHTMGLATGDSKLLAAALNGDAKALDALISRSRDARKALGDLGITVEDLANQDPRKIYATLAAAYAALGGTPSPLPDYLGEGIEETESWISPELRQSWEGVAARAAHANTQGRNRLKRFGQGLFDSLTLPFRWGAAAGTHAYDVVTQGYGETHDAQARAERDAYNREQLNRVLAQGGTRPRHDIEMSVRISEYVLAEREKAARIARGSQYWDRTIRIFDNTTGGIRAGDRVEQVNRSGQVVGGELLTPEGRG